jgi:penicillin-binding protein 1A
MQDCLMSRFRRLLRWALLAFLVRPSSVPGTGLLYLLISPKLPDVDQLRHVELQEPMYVYPATAPDGAVRRDAPLPDRDREGPAAPEAGLHRHRGRALLQAPRRRLQGRRARGVAAGHHRRKRVPGGSTITQQVARQFFLSSNTATRASSPR